MQAYRKQSEDGERPAYATRAGLVPVCPPQGRPRQGIAAALVLDLTGREHIEPVIVVDFYREADLP